MRGGADELCGRCERDGRVSPAEHGCAAFFIRVVALSHHGLSLLALAKHMISARMCRWPM